MHGTETESYVYLLLHARTGVIARFGANKHTHAHMLSAMHRCCPWWPRSARDSVCVFAPTSPWRSYESPATHTCYTWIVDLRLQSSLSERPGGVYVSLCVCMHALFVIVDRRNLRLPNSNHSGSSCCMTSQEMEKISHGRLLSWLLFPEAAQLPVTIERLVTIATDRGNSIAVDRFRSNSPGNWFAPTVLSVVNNKLL